MSVSRRLLRNQTRLLRFESFDALRDYLLTHHPQAAHVTVEHGPHCSPEACRCRPTYVLRACTPENVQRGALAQAKWRKVALS
jgi:hypothetical protein